jgi:hypothetical protein
MQEKGRLFDVLTATRPRHLASRFVCRVAAGVIRTMGIPQQPPVVDHFPRHGQLGFADNASNGIEPAFSWMYKRKKRESDGSTTE